MKGFLCALCCTPIEKKLIDKGINDTYSIILCDKCKEMVLNPFKRHLDIIMIHYQEEDWYIERALESIRKQKKIDFSLLNIYVVTDKNGIEPHLEVSDLNVHFIRSDYENGISGTRNYGVDNSNGDYILFMDCDDILESESGLYELLELAKKNGYPDIVMGGYIEEDVINGVEQIKRPNEYSAVGVMHGKMYKRECLTRLNHKFDTNFKMSEDVLYNITLITKTDSVVYDNTIDVYRYKYNNKSITREGQEQIPVFLRAFKTTIDAESVWFDHLVEGRYSLMSTDVIGLFLQVIFYQLQIQLLTYPEKSDLLNYLGECCKKYLNYFNFDKIKECEVRIKNQIPFELPSFTDFCLSLQ